MRDSLEYDKTPFGRMIFRRMVMGFKLRTFIRKRDVDGLIELLLSCHSKLNTQKKNTDILLTNLDIAALEDTLLQLLPDSRDSLLRILETPDHPLAFSALDILSSAREPRVLKPALTMLESTTSSEDTEEILWHLGELLGKKTLKEFPPEVQALLTYFDGSSRNEGNRSVGKGSGIFEQDAVREVVLAITRCLDDENENVRFQAYVSLKKIDDEVTYPLLEAFEKKNPSLAFFC